ncbi:uncharacterized protein MONBRDRAFT_27286 [Monosiga brevicollis MX1]|uniref:EF-hand domain-containing protein n=1 Tax=Monosiga brevicollis TaxID=81824 RepID=A9V4V1_MONBE|nr:uncharacterized protein MONBRDRAFT_27286 [Monosiga brevicollis MX1]EDQ87433.1 predicted protein [Monosiga brevicollis MX1]|eukprot:XP_001747693.1 hypothetical protein [Monosiga brevicollis MX1]
MAHRSEKLKLLEELTESTHSPPPSLPVPTHLLGPHACIPATSTVSLDEINALHRMFKSLTDTETMAKPVFRELLHDYFSFTDDQMMDKIFKAFAKTENVLSFETFVTGLSTFLRGTVEEQVEQMQRVSPLSHTPPPPLPALVVFNIYTRGSMEAINRDDMCLLLKKSIVKPASEEERDEGIRDLVDMLLRKMDKDGDHLLSLEDYKKSVAEDKLLLEALGPCLPNGKDVKEFLAAAEVLPRI